ncbi:hypothetical protein SSS_04757 [Sarcoptes scabiei]|nr:hypothetical protein SSS_04757 [Sarcoptes scabiei]
MANNESNQIEMHLKNHLKKLFADYEKLQLEFARLRKKFSELQIKSKIDINTGQQRSGSSLSTDSNSCSNNNNKNRDDLQRKLEQEKLSRQSTYAELSYLTKEMKKIESRYADLLDIIAVQKELQICDHKSNDKDENNRLQELEIELKELKETLDFLTSENNVLKDLEERTFKERLDWIEEKKKYEEVVIWSKHINDKYKATKLNRKRKFNQTESKIGKFFRIRY